MIEHRYGELERCDSRMEELSKRPYRPPDVHRLAEAIDEAKADVDMALLALKVLQEKAKTTCTHALRDMLYREYTLVDTLGNQDGVEQYVTCTLCGKELWRKTT